MRERVRDAKIRKARVIVEHYFGRMKVCFPILNKFRFKREMCGFVVRTCAMLTNIIILMQCPMRFAPCTADRTCYVCTHMPENRFAVRLAHRSSASAQLADVIDQSLACDGTVELAALVEGADYNGSEYNLDAIDDIPQEN